MRYICALKYLRTSDHLNIIVIYGSTLCSYCRGETLYSISKMIDRFKNSVIGLFAEV